MQRKFEIKKKSKSFADAIIDLLLLFMRIILSDMLILKMTLVVLAAVIIMSFYFEISIKKSVIFALLYQGLSIIVDYIAYISNNTIISKAGEVQKGYALEGSLVVIFSKITVFLCILLLKNTLEKINRDFT